MDFLRLSPISELQYRHFILPTSMEESRWDFAASVPPTTTQGSNDTFPTLRFFKGFLNHKSKKILHRQTLERLTKSGKITKRNKVLQNSFQDITYFLKAPLTFFRLAKKRMSDLSGGPGAV